MSRVFTEFLHHVCRRRVSRSRCAVTMALGSVSTSTATIAELLPSSRCSPAVLLISLGRYIPVSSAACRPVDRQPRSKLGYNPCYHQMRSFKLKIKQNRFLPGLRPDPAGTTVPRLLSGLARAQLRPPRRLRRLHFGARHCIVGQAWSPTDNFWLWLLVHFRRVCCLKFVAFCGRLSAM